MARAIVERSWPDGPPGGGTRFFFQVMILHSRLGCGPHYVGFRRVPRRGFCFRYLVSRQQNATHDKPQPASQPHTATTTDASPLSRVRADDRTEVRAQYSSSYH